MDAGCPARAFKTRAANKYPTTNWRRVRRESRAPRIACGSQTLVVLRQDSGDVYSVMIASRLSAAATIKTIVNSVAHMVDAPRFPDTDLKAGHQL
jgi:hypothetical protein